MTAALNVLQLQLSPLPPSSLAPIKPGIDTFWHWLTQVHLEKKMTAKMEWKSINIIDKAVKLNKMCEIRL